MTASLTALDLTAATNAIARSVITAAMQAVADAFDVALPAAVKRAKTTAAAITVPPGGWKVSRNIAKAREYTAEKPDAAGRRKYGTFATAVAKMWRAGKSSGEIAKSLGVKAGRVTHEVWRQRRAGELLEQRRGGAKPVPHGVIRAGTKAERIANLFRAGKTHGEIAAALGISKKDSGVVVAKLRARGVAGLDARQPGARKAVTP